MWVKQGNIVETVYQDPSKALTKSLMCDFFLVKKLGKCR